MIIMAINHSLMDRGGQMTVSYKTLVFNRICLLSKAWPIWDKARQEKEINKSCLSLDRSTSRFWEYNKRYATATEYLQSCKKIVGVLFNSQTWVCLVWNSVHLTPSFCARKKAGRFVKAILVKKEHWILKHSRIFSYIVCNSEYGLGTQFNERKLCVCFVTKIDDN